MSKKIEKEVTIILNKPFVRWVHFGLFSFYFCRNLFWLLYGLFVENKIIIKNSMIAAGIIGLSAGIYGAFLYWFYPDEPTKPEDYGIDRSEIKNYKREVFERR